MTPDQRRRVSSETFNHHADALVVLRSVKNLHTPTLLQVHRHIKNNGPRGTLWTFDGKARDRLENYITEMYVHQNTPEWSFYHDHVLN